MSNKKKTPCSIPIAKVEIKDNFSMTTLQSIGTEETIIKGTCTFFTIKG